MRFVFSLLLTLISLGICAQDSDFEERKYTKEKKLNSLFTVEFNMAFGILDVESVTMAGLQTSYGIELGDQLTVGAGTGLHLYESERFLPLFGEFRYLPGNGSTRIMLGGSIGAYYGGDDNSWDRYINPFMGFSNQAFENIHFTVSLGITYKEYQVPNEPVRLPGGGFSNIAGTREVIGRFFSVRFGCRF
ncbi:hypothetical protein O3Q51_00160 [Cryomorphaceae bacterium 1068]|nr:hypothetical protein [Cryomorphaceae bacterium 1068]